ncbi:MAG: hypothetical protein DMF96_12795 [Acidobacteria bacterium]|nr:MAG: hypothetical protein DMF96_12795 [Acidobacteriota bacterium]
MTWLWGLMAAVAILWPDRISGPFDGVPLDGLAEAALIGLVFPALWWFHPRFLRTTRAHACILVLVAWKICSTLLFVQDGWCVTFEPARPFAKDAGRAPHAWDLRADWRAPDPACSAIMTRSYRELSEFPAWFFNLPPPNDSWPEPVDRPPAATVAMRVHGYVSAPSAGVLQFEGAPGVGGWASVDGRRLTGVSPAASVGPGRHYIAIDAVLTGNDWALIARWNGLDLWQRATATVRRPSPIDLAVRPWIRWIPTLAVLSLLSLWAASAIARIGDMPVLAWMAGMSMLIGLLTYFDNPVLSRWAIAALGAAVLVPVPPRLRNICGACALIGIPWLTFVLVGGIPSIGRFRIYTSGDDYWMYQRFGYRIVMQGYWLEGGSQVFYFQPFYRWISGLLHAVFGDSSVGERFWDGMCLLAGALLSFRITRPFAGFRWGLVATAMPLAVFALGTARYLIGYGLSEISSAGLMSMAALYAIRSRGRGTIAAIAAGVLATLGFYTRLNNGIMAVGVALFALPLSLPLCTIVRPAAWWRRVSWRTVFGVGGVIALGLLFFAWRTYHFTGVFSVFYGTQRYIVAIWQPGMALKAYVEGLIYNVMLVLTVNDPPRFDVYALPVLGGALIAMLSVIGAPRLRELPAVAVLFFFASIAGAFITRGWVYAGRFSVHVLPITCALATCGCAQWIGRARRRAPSGRTAPCVDPRES